jgi:hypothetical protein
MKSKIKSQTYLDQVAMPVRQHAPYHVEEDVLQRVQEGKHVHERGGVVGVGRIVLVVVIIIFTIAVLAVDAADGDPLVQLNRTRHHYRALLVLLLDELVQWVRVEIVEIRQRLLQDLPPLLGLATTCDE